MSVVSRLKAGLAGVVALAPIAARADVPVLDRVPAGAPVIVVVPHVGKLLAGIDAVAKLGVPVDQFRNLFKLEGLNQESSAAAALIPGADGKVDFQADTPPFLLIIPVSDFAKFVTGCGGDPSQPLPEVDPFDTGEPGFARNLGDGYAIMGPDRAMVEGFKGVKGNAARHQAVMGAAGRATIESSAISVLVDVQAFGPQIQAGLEGAKQQMQMFGAAAGQGQAANMEFLDAIGLTLSRDGQSTVFAANAGENGMSLHWTAQFKEGSESAAKLQGKGNAGALLDRLPAQPFLFAASMDLSLPGVKALFKAMLDTAANAEPQNAEALGLTGAWAKSLNSIDGASVIVGASPAGLMGGLFTNAAAYIKTKDAAGYAAAMKDSLTQMNGKTARGFTYQTSYTPKSGAAAADEWSMRMQPDQNDPNAQMAMMQLGVIFGPEGGLGGFVAPTGDGVVTTYSRNSKLLEQAVASAKSGGFNADGGVKAVSQALPDNRTMEAYIGIGPILEAVQMFMAMQGAGGDAEVPKDLPPIGIGGCTESGGVRLTLFAPTRVLEAISQMTGAGNDKGAGQPGF